MTILYAKEDKIATITVDRPEALNSLDPKGLEELADALIKFRDDPEVYVAIITGSGDRAFCAGADLKALIPVLTTYQPPAIIRRWEIWKPIIGAINGMALGGGHELALACDIRIASENATFGQPEVKWGILPGWGGTQRLPRLISQAKAAEMIMMGNTIDAKEAHRIGLVNEVVPLAELMPTAKKWAATICENAPLAVRAGKEAMIRGMGMSLDDGLRLECTLFDLMLRTEDGAEGPRAFAERRKPTYKGK